MRVARVLAALRARTMLAARAVIMLAAPCTLGLASWDVQAAEPEPLYAPVVPGYSMQFPRDYGSHPAFRTEWWYVTGWLTTADGQALGFQVTFFRTKPAVDARNPSAFTPRQLLIAHLALSDPRLGHLLHDQRIRRAGMGLAEAAEGDTHVWIDDWSLEHRASGVYETHIVAEDFALRLALEETQAPMLNGEAGFSRKGPEAGAASYYYSVPHLKVTGTAVRGDHSDAVTGEAWLDHEWSSEYLDAEAAGWDWIGINLDDGGALMAFRIRGLDGKARWAGGTLRGRHGAMQILGPDQVRFQAGASWSSPRTGTSYPVKWQIRAGEREFSLQPLMEDQENDARLSTGAIYWEGAVQAFEGSRQVGRGYLELTGYHDKLHLP